MPFDANLILVDGTIDMDTGTDTAPSSTTRDDTTGAAIIEINETGKDGLTAVLIIPDGAEDIETLIGFIEVSDEDDFASDVHEMGKFDVAAASKGVILGSELPCTAFLKFATDKKYVRANITVNEDFGKVKCYLSPYPFKTL